MPDPSVEKAKETRQTASSVTSRNNLFTHRQGNDQSTSPKIAILEDNKMVLFAIKKKLPSDVAAYYDQGQYKPDEEPGILKELEKRIQQGEPIPVIVADCNIDSENIDYEDGIDIVEQASYLYQSYNMDAVYVLNSSEQDKNETMAKTIKMHLPNAYIHSYQDKLAFTNNIDTIMDQAKQVEAQAHSVIKSVPENAQQAGLSIENPASEAPQSYSEPDPASVGPDNASRQHQQRHDVNKNTEAPKFSPSQGSNEEPKQNQDQEPSHDPSPNNPGNN